jgi:hypothetical protein
MSAPRPVNDRTGARDAYLALLAGDRGQGRLLEIRLATRRGMRRRFIPATRLDQASSVIAMHAPDSDVYIGVLLRERRAGGRDAVAPSHLAFVEIDRPDAQQRLERFARPPSLVVSSGSPGHVHAYFRLQTPVGVTELERANRRLAHRLGGDLSSVDSARVLRPCASLNHKHTPPAPVRLVSYEPTLVYEPAELLDGLAEPPAASRSASPGQRRTARHPLDELLLAVPADEYVRALAGREPNRAGKLACPFHNDTRPSLQLYQDGTWYCYGCRMGGSVYDFAAAMWDMSTKDREFLELRDRLARALGIATPPRSTASSGASRGPRARG